VSTRVIRNGVPDFGPWSSEPSSIALVAGRISPEKGTAAAIRVARRAGLSPLLVGDVYDRSYFERDVEPLLRTGEFVGPVSRRRLSGLMASSAVVLMPIEWTEPFGLVAAEAQMAGCPVVGYRRGALPELVVGGLTGYLVEPGDEDALVRAIAHTQKLDRSAIRARAKRYLGVERMVDEYEAALRSVGAEFGREAVLESQHLERSSLGARHSRRSSRHAGEGNPVDVGTP
jgi:glycosyltransferase involved in cell wall biosynthesis